MIKGCNRRVIVMRETGNAMIEEAIFILKSGGAGAETLSEADIVKHANSILDKSCCDGRLSRFTSASPRQKNNARTPTFAAGAVTGAIIAVCIMVII